MTSVGATKVIRNNVIPTSSKQQFQKGSGEDVLTPRISMIPNGMPFEF